MHLENIIKNQEKRKSQKLKTKIEFSFEDQEDLPEIDVDMNLKTHDKSSHINIVKNKKKTKDASINLF